MLLSDQERRRCWEGILPIASRENCLTPIYDVARHVQSILDEKGIGESPLARRGLIEIVKLAQPESHRANIGESPIQVAERLPKHALYRWRECLFMADHCLTVSDHALPQETLIPETPTFEAGLRQSIR
jgi:hypothetical protein